MPIPLPNLDDRTWADLVDEARTLIPFYAPEWTDQNVSDPGITLIELLATFTEMDIFQLNRITDRARSKYLGLVDIHPEPPHPSYTPLAFKLLSGASISLPSNLIFSGPDSLGVATPFRTLAAVQVVPAQLAAVQVKDTSGFRDMTDRWQRGIGFGIFGDVPVPGAELYLGFDKPLAAGEQISLYFGFAGGRSERPERAAILKEADAARKDCTSTSPVCGPETVVTACSRNEAPLPPFRGARTSWEILTVGGWIGITAVNDDTRTCTLDGTVRITPPVSSTPQKLGQVSTPLSYVRMRFAAGAYDAPPVASAILMNAVQAEQSAAVGVLTWNIATGVIASPETPPSQITGLDLQFDSNGNINGLKFVSDRTPKFSLLRYAAATVTNPGSLTVEAVFLGAGDGTPAQQFQFPQAPLKPASLALFSYEGGAFVSWRLRSDFDSSTPGDRDFLLDPTLGAVSFGDGNKGMAPSAGSNFFASFLATRAAAGNIGPGTIKNSASAKALVDSPHNRAILPSFDSIVNNFDVNNPLAATGGAAAESLGHAIGRAAAAINAPQRAVTLGDYETLAMQVPGTVVARARAWANLHPSFPCFEAPGMIALLILPNMPGPRPVPSAALLDSVAAYLNRRRILGSRLIVAGPTYREVAVQAQVKALPGASKTGVQQRIVDALNAYFDPLTGGPDSTGWPFGRDVHQAEVMQVIEKVSGADYIPSMSLIADGCSCAPQCGNVCLSPGELVAAGQHEIKVI